MTEFRLASVRDFPDIKDIWKEAFGDEDNSIRFFYQNYTKIENAAVCVAGGTIAAMLTMIPVKAVTRQGKKQDAAMLYAIATRSAFRGNGYSTQLVEYSHQLLAKKNINIAVLVPAEDTLFRFYENCGFRTEFCIREAVINREKAESVCRFQSPEKKAERKLRMEPAAPHEYNQRRREFLRGKRFIDYDDNDIAYQKCLSKSSGADIFTLDIGGEKGCVAVERISEEKIIIKEMLLKRALIDDAISQITDQINAKIYILRTPDFIDHQFTSRLIPFGMMKTISPGFNLQVSDEESGYLGLAFD